MRLLIIGGSVFLGWHLVEAALARGDAVTLFNRGRSASPRSSKVEQRQGDRKGDLAALAAGEWDAVVDCCGYLPRDVARMAECLHGRVGRYVFISSISVYAGFKWPNDEDSALGRIEDSDTETVDGRTYGPLKALCRGCGHGALRRIGFAADPPRPHRRPARPDPALHLLAGARGPGGRW